MKKHLLFVGILTSTLLLTSSDKNSSSFSTSAIESEEADKKLAATTTTIMPLPRRHLKDVIQNSFADVIGATLAKDFTPIIYDYYYLHPSTAPDYFDEKTRKKAYGAAAHFNEQDNNYVITTGISTDTPFGKLDIALRDETSKCRIHRNVIEFLDQIGRRASDYTTGFNGNYVGKDTERKVLMDRSAIETALPRIHMAVRTAYILEGPDGFMFPSCALLDCAAYYPHPTIFKSLLSLLPKEARAVSSYFPKIVFFDRSSVPTPSSLSLKQLNDIVYIDDVLPKGHPFENAARAFLLERAQHEMRNENCYTEEEIQEASRVTNTIASMIAYLLELEEQRTKRKELFVRADACSIS